jgi:antitoxin (DNA-binding transcriptional repressor) of toxin-antitoxin stability system
MNKVSKSELKRRMLEIFREIQRTGEAVIVTDHRVPVLKVVALSAGASVTEVFGPFRGEVTVDDGALEPTEEEWPLT